MPAVLSQRREYLFGLVLALGLIAWFIYIAISFKPSLLLQVVMNAFVLGLTYLLIAWGLTLMFGIMHLMNFAHGDFYMFGAFMVWYFMVKNGFLADAFDKPFNYIFASLFAIAVVGILGVFVERFLFRPFGEDILPAFIISLAVGMILITGMLVAFGLLPKTIPGTFEGIVRPFGAAITNERIAMVVIALIVILLIMFWVLRTKSGRAMRAIRADHDAAALQGINIGNYRSLVMFIGCALAAIAGALVGPIYTVHPYMGAVPLMKAFAIIVLGGVGSLPGAVLGGFFIGFLESFGATMWGVAVADMLSFLIVILVLTFKPTGLMGRAH